MPGILVVEDDENLNRGITFSLEKSGYEVFSAESVKKAKRIASDNNVDVTICDTHSAEHRFPDPQFPFLQDRFFFVTR
jgi:two-component system, OmpR family, response regulator VicR